MNNLQEHDIIDGQVCDTLVHIDASLVGEYECLMNIVFADAEETVQGTVHFVVLTRLHLNRDKG